MRRLSLSIWREKWRTLCMLAQRRLWVPFILISASQFFYTTNQIMWSCFLFTFFEFFYFDVWSMRGRSARAASISRSKNFSIFLIGLFSKNLHPNFHLRFGPVLSQWQNLCFCCEDLQTDEQFPSGTFSFLVS